MHEEDPQGSGQLIADSPALPSIPSTFEAKLMRTCAFCSRGLRWDEVLKTVQVCQDDQPGVAFLVSLWGVVDEPTVGGQACPDCAAKLRGEPPPVARTYPQGGPIPRHPDPQRARMGAPLPICGLCRLALPEPEEKGRPIRLAPEDVEGTAYEPGLYDACQECHRRFEPAVRKRLWLAGLWDDSLGRPPLETVPRIAGDMLM